MTSELQSPMWSVINDVVVEHRHLPYDEAFRFAEIGFKRDNTARIVVTDAASNRLQKEKESIESETKI